LDRSKLQAKSDAFWQRTDTTYLAAADYYDRQEAELRALIRDLPRANRIADIGCGDGRYTLVAREYADAVCGWDFSEKLIEQARRKADGLSDVTFAVGSFEETEREGPFATVLCLGVFSAIFGDEAFSSAVRSLRSSISDGGYLITKDTLAVSGAFHVEQGEYTAVYRSQEDYVRDIEGAGFTLRTRRELIKATGATQNSLYVFEATAS
jgi:SAM-dependent methyltransferase